MNDIPGSTADTRLRVDEEIYLREDRAANTKEVFVAIADQIETLKGPSVETILDVGCATGEMLYYLETRFPKAQLNGVDVSEPLISEARRIIPKATFEYGSVLEPETLPSQNQDVVILTGVLGLFDDPKEAIGNLISCACEGGVVLITSPFNPNPVDVIVRHRVGGDDSSTRWERGWNIFSKSSIDSMLSGFDQNLNWSWTEFKLPFELEKKVDPMRAWTESFPHDEFQLVNGACQMLFISILAITVTKHVSDQNT